MGQSSGKYRNTVHNSLRHIINNTLGHIVYIIYIKIYNGMNERERENERKRESVCVRERVCV